MMFTSGRDNLALTIYAPYDCPNNCSFCTSKKMYSEKKADLQKVISSINDIFTNHNFPFKDVVITGGEPTANILLLAELVNAIPDEMNVYINTTLLARTFDEFCYFLVSSFGKKIKGVNVSRHASSYEEETLVLHHIATDEQIAKLASIVPVRINCVNANKNNYEAIIQRWENTKIELSFRADFTTIKTDFDLHNPYNDFACLLALRGYYTNHTQCGVCDTVSFKDKSGLSVRYHRGKESTCYRVGQSEMWKYNDVIIYQDGSISIDWNDNKQTKELTKKALEYMNVNKKMTNPCISINNTCGSIPTYSNYHCGSSGCGMGCTESLYSYGCGSVGCR